MRRDIDGYMENDKRMPRWRLSGWEDNGEGIAAALAVLNSHTVGGSSNSC